MDIRFLKTLYYLLQFCALADYFFANSSLSEEIPREVAVAELLGKKWIMRFDGLAMTTSNGLELC